MIVRDFTVNGGFKCTACHREPVLMTRCLCDQWYCEAHFRHHYDHCTAVLELTAPWQFVPQ